MNLQETLNNRYTVKKFDAEKKISAEDMAELKELLRLSPSSTNIQPWHFVIGSSEDAKARIAKSTENYGFNTQKILDASAVVVFAASTEMTDAHLNAVLDQEEQDGRFPLEQYKNDMDGGRRFFLDYHRFTLKDDKHWMEKQAYLNIGHFALGSASLGIDSVIMEGCDMAVLDAEFGLREKNMTAMMVVAIGYRAEDDFNADLPKSRLSEEVVITELA